MKKVSVAQLNSEVKDIISTTNRGLVAKLANGDILKLFNPFYLAILQGHNYRMDEKLMVAERMDIPKGIISPKTLAYDSNGSFSGYTMESAKGRSFKDFSDEFVKREHIDLKEIAEIYTNLERIVKKNNSIVIPDLCTLSNMFIDDNRSFQLIDYDGMQIGNHASDSVSMALCGQHLREQLYYKNPKYFKNGLFTKNLDKKSLACIYFMLAFTQRFPDGGPSGEIVTKENLSDLLDYIGLDDKEICDKIASMFFSQNDNEYLGDDVFRIAEKYDTISISAAPISPNYIRKLVPKRE